MIKRLVMWLLALILLTAGTAGAQFDISEASQLNVPGMTVGVDQGSAAESTVRELLPQASVSYFTDKFMGYTAVAQGKIDAFVYDRAQMQLAIENGQPGVHLLNETLGDAMQIAVGLSPVSRIPDLENQVNRFIADIRADGTLDDMYRRWVIDENEIMPPVSLPDNPDLLLMVGTSGIVPPYSYYKDGALTGYDIELAYRFAAWLGAGVTFKVYDYGAIVPAAITGDVDCIMANLNVTPERQEVLPFSDILYEDAIGIMVRGEAQAELSSADMAVETDHDAAPAGQTVGGQAGTNTDTEDSFRDSLVSSFNKTFLRENRWQLFLAGIGTTMLITLLSILFGTALGFVVFMLCRNGNPLANGVTRICIWLVTGTPTVVLLMILYYIIFGSVAISGIAVAVIGFSLTFGSAVFGLIRMGAGTVDRGQYEAAYALGNSNRHTFFRIILPQAIPHVLPAYQGEIVGLIKATAIVGYIAVQDLTKMGDIIRSRTYEAFFPLIAVTVIYFVLEWLLSFAVSRLRIRLDPKKRSRARILKGIDLH